MRANAGTDPPVDGLAGRMACTRALTVFRCAATGAFAGRNGQAPGWLAAMASETAARSRTYTADGSWRRFIPGPRRRNLSWRRERPDCPAAAAGHCSERPAGPGQEP